ncbi:DUF2878 domain-containing protein [Agaribacterium sp. ZY112]|uniref:DUF2878 domain-containing protein n=1 Tax=Agaribacterium sp. ZY112 TaxID=3233574 RepID=UPI00352447B9
MLSNGSTKKSISLLLLNILGFNLVWFACIFLGNTALIPALLFLGLHLYLQTQLLIELKVVVLLGLLGFLIDSLLALVGVFVFDQQAVFAPFWLLLLWFCFAATLRHSLAVFAKNLAVACAFGGIGGALSYFSAKELGAVSFAYSDVSMAVALSLLWAVKFPFLLHLSQRLVKSQFFSYPLLPARLPYRPSKPSHLNITTKKEC